MSNRGQEDNLVKLPVTDISRDLTEIYVKEFVKEAIRQILQKKEDTDAEKLDQAWKNASEQEKAKYLDQLEEKIFEKTKDGLADDHELLKTISDIIENDFIKARIFEPKRSPLKKILESNLIKGFVALIVIGSLIYFAIPIIFPAQLSVSETDLDFGDMEERTPSSKTFLITNLGKGTLTWSVNTDESWIGLSPTSGINNGYVRVAIKGTPKPGLHGGVINVRSNIGAKQEIRARLYVKSPPIISIDPSYLNFEMRVQEIPSSQTLKISNSGERNLYWQATANEPWIILNNNEGTNDGEIEVSIRGYQDPGIYRGTIALKSNDRDIDVPVTLESIAPAKMTVSSNPLIFNFDAYSDKQPQSQTFRIANEGGDLLNWHISSSGNPWIVITPASGQLDRGKSEEVIVGVDTQNLEFRDYSGTFAVTSNGGNADGTVELKRVSPLY